MRKSVIRRAVKLAVTAFYVAAAITAVAALAIQYRIHVANEWQQHVALPRAPAPSKTDRILVFAPHSDDETLGCGGMLAMAARNGARVRVVLLTNGDGYRIAVARAYKTFKASPDKCVEFAYKRQAETLKALRELGVSDDNVTFLGYPDRGIAALWDRHWGNDDLYVSHATHWNRSPYNNSYTPNAPYCGESLLSDIQTIIRDEHPTDVYMPHPCDNHSDHYATYCFVTAAIEQLEAERYSLARKIKVHTYLVHRGDWPCPKGEHLNEPLSPPFSLTGGDTKWSSLPLPSDIAEAKLRAIKCYKTQTNIERGFLLSFARTNEVFGNIPTRRVENVATGRITVDGDPEDWSGIAPAVVSPVGDYVVADMNRGGDIRAIYLSADAEKLYVRLNCVRSISRRINYTVRFNRIGESSTAKYTVEIKPGSYCKPAGVTWAFRKNVMEIAIPLDALNFGEDLFVQAQTRLMKLTLDNTGWHGLEFAPSITATAESKSL